MHLVACACFNLWLEHVSSLGYVPVFIFCPWCSVVGWFVFLCACCVQIGHTQLLGTRPTRRAAIHTMVIHALALCASPCAFRLATLRSDLTYGWRKHRYSDDQLRVFNFLIETWRVKKPHVSELGDDSNMLAVAAHGDGHVPRNVRLAMFFTDMVQVLASPFRSVWCALFHPSARFDLGFCGCGSRTWHGRR